MAPRFYPNLPTTRIAKVSVVGLGKLGLCLAAVLASRGFEISGIDTDAAKVQAVNSGASPIYEPGVEELIRKNSKRLSATTTYEGVIAPTGATFVVVPTPSDDSGAFSLRHVQPAVERIGKELAKKDGYHLVVVTSTVMPGSMDEAVKPTLERASGKPCGASLGLCYNPEFIALGEVIRGLLSPDFILVGESDRKAGDVLSAIQARVCTNSPPVERMNFINAEVAKIGVNSFITMKMSFANTLAEISEKLPGANVDRITGAIGRDHRIGSAYLKGALGYGGPCFLRDNIAFAKFASDIGTQAGIAKATHGVNLTQVDRVIRLAKETGLRKTSKVGLLGLSYKPNTDVVEESQSLGMARVLADQGYEVHVYDPAAMENARTALGNRVTYEPTAEKCLKSSDYIIVATPWSAFRKLQPEHFKGKVVLDIWRLLDTRVSKVSKVVAVGIGR